MIRLSEFRQIKFLTLTLPEHVTVCNAAELMEMVPGILFSRGGKNRGHRCDIEVRAGQHGAARENYLSGFNNKV